MKRDKDRLTHNINRRGAGSLLGTVGMGSFASVGDHVRDQPGKLDEGWFLSVEVGQKCHLDCRHCIYESSAAEPPNPRIKEALSQTLDDGRRFKWVSLSGKEPTYFHRELVDMVKLLRKPEHSLILMTNGLALKGALMDDLLPLIDCFDVSVDGDRSAHDWMRGAGQFDKTWSTLRELVEKKANLIGVIATAVSSILPDGRRQIESVVELARQLNSDFAMTSQVSLSLSLYYGAPGDPLLLNIDELEALMRGVQGLDLPVQVLVTANYSHMWSELIKRLNLEHLQVQFDSATDIPVLVDGNVRFVLFNLCETSLTTLRLGNSGQVFLGCNHLALSKDAERHGVGDLALNDLSEIMGNISTADISLIRNLSEIPKTCSNCDEWNHCRGGDRLSGIYFKGAAQDPYCPQLVS